MKNWLGRCLPALSIVVLAGCGGSNDGNAPPPADVAVTAGDGWMQVNFTRTGGLDYWVFTATDAALSPTNWLNLTGAGAFVNVVPPFVLCSQTNGRERWFTVNARSGSDPGGPGSPAKSATPRAAGATWTSAGTLAADVNAVGFAGLTTCLRTGLARGVLTAVGPTATIFSSTDNAANWSARSAPAGFTADLNAVASFTASINNTSNPGVRTVAVGAGGAALVSNDSSATWTVGQPFNAANAALRGIAAVGSSFIAVGDSGTIRSTSDGITWNTLNSGSTVNLRGVAFGSNRYVAVGDGGTVLTSTDLGQSWASTTVSGAGALRAVAFGNNYNDVANSGSLLINTFMAVGDDGKGAVSSDGGATWSAVTIAGAGQLVGIAYTSRFVAVDSAGNAFTSADGKTWSGPIATGRTGLRSVAQSGYGYIAVGGAGAAAASF